VVCTSACAPLMILCTTFFLCFAFGSTSAKPETKYTFVMWPRVGDPPFLFIIMCLCMQVRFKKNNVAIDCGGTITAGDVLTHDFVPPEGFQMVIEAGGHIPFES
jgi:hypothetical protein